MPRNFQDWRRGDPADAERLTRQHKARNQGIVGGRGIDVVRGHDVLVIQLKESRIIPSPCCDLLGACCVADGVCVEDTAESVCLEEGGDWAGPGTDCDPNPCRGACCQGLNGETCVPDRTRSECEEDAGIFQGPGVGCTPNPCDSTPGACCYGQTCVPGQTQAVCENQNGNWQGPGTDCDPDPCVSQPDPGGACCVGETCHPNETAQSCCLLGGDWQGPNVPCDPNPCGEATEGSCCTGPAHNTCVPNVTKGQCCVFNGGTGHWNGPGSSCGPPDPCTVPPPTGACCFGPPPPPTQSCVPNQTQLECQGEGGTWYPGQDCTPQECQGEPPTTGACCESGPLPQACHADWTAIQCSVIGGSWFPGEPCTPAACLGEPPTTGACCESGAGGPCLPDLSNAECTKQCPQCTWFAGEPCTPDECLIDPPTVGACCELNAGGPCLPNLTAAECAKQCPQCAWFAGQECTPAECEMEPPTMGACCPPDGQCIPDIDQETCEKFNQGIWLGIGSDCGPPNPCPGACCFGSFNPDQQCLTANEQECLNIPGNWHGPGSSCFPLPADCIGIPPGQGACCELGAGGPCLPGLTVAECAKQCPQCAWFGGQLCTPVECELKPPTIGACCFGLFDPDQQCVEVDQPSCADLDGNWHGPGTVCNPLPADCIGIPPGQGACCPSPGNVPCIITTEALCDGDYLGDGSDCGPPDPCIEGPPTGACCAPVAETPGGGIEICIDDTTSKECMRFHQGRYMGDGTTCDTVNCNIIEPPVLGACCTPANICVMLLEPDCIELDGVWHAPPATCATTQCSIEAVDCCLPDCTCLTVGDTEACDALGGESHELFFCSQNLCCVGCCRFIPQDCINVQTCDICESQGGVCLGQGTSCEDDFDMCDICCCLGDPGGGDCGPPCFGMKPEECTAAKGIPSIVNCCIVP